MTRPTDASIARAFWERWKIHGDEMNLRPGIWVALHERAKQLDAESPADVHTIPEKVSTSPQRVQIPAEPERGYCTLCRGNVWVGHNCNGPQCPMRSRR